MEIKKPSLTKFANIYWKHKTGHVKYIIDPIYFPSVRAQNGIELVLDDDIAMYPEVLQYDLSKIDPTDKIIDVGANIGMFSLTAYYKSKNILAVEPLKSSILRQNINLNNAHEISVMDVALGDGSICDIFWSGQCRQVKTMTLSQIIQVSGGCDVLKIDCEGGEWKINPTELSGIKQISAEFHYFDGLDINDNLMDYIRDNYLVNIVESNKKTVVFNAFLERDDK